MHEIGCRCRSGKQRGMLCLTLAAWQAADTSLSLNAKLCGDFLDDDLSCEDESLMSILVRLNSTWRPLLL